MKVEEFLERIPSNFFTGVPDSQLKALCDSLMESYGISERHIIAVNEGNAVGLAAGYFLATGKVPTVYLQNSGEGNAMNPLASLCAKSVYAIPMLLIIGYRGEPGVKDEPQHVFQGEITLAFLDMMQIPYFVLEKESTKEELEEACKRFSTVFSEGRQAAIVVKKGALTREKSYPYANSHSLVREEAIQSVLRFSGKNPIVSTTGKISREVYEIRDAKGEGHGLDFLTVGSMGHASSIALGIALEKKEKKVFCLDGDGAALMHMGAMATIGSCGPKNFIHILFNNEAHETVGGQPTVSKTVNYRDIATAVGYRNVYLAKDENSLETALAKSIIEEGPVFIEIACSVYSRSDLGRPKTTAVENKEAFMAELQKPLLFE